jgi:acetyltransferase-like isoleucine patch superfamily enzyme
MNYKLIIGQIIFSIGNVLSYFYPDKIKIFFDKIKEEFYTGWISRKVKHLGQGSVINHPITLIGGKYISIGKKTRIGKNGIITAFDSYLDVKYNPHIEIGENVVIQEYCHITSVNKIIIGNNTIIGKWVTITDNAHGKSDGASFLTPPIKRRIVSPGIVFIEDNIWIGDKVTILPNVHIGKNAIIGANSVVTKNIPANCVAAGVPAEVKKIIG